LIGGAGFDGAHDVDARDDGAVVVGRPSHEGEDGAGAEGDDAPPAVDDPLTGLAAKADPVFDPLLDPGQFDMGERIEAVGGRHRAAANAGGRGAGHKGSPSSVGNSRASKSRSMSATVTPRWNAAILIRPRSSGVTSMVNRAV